MGVWQPLALIPISRRSFDRMSTSSRPRRRLSEAVDLLKPLRRAQQLQDFFLYWMPVSSYPMPQLELDWLNQFLRRLSKHFEQQGMRAEVFLEYKSVYPNLLDKFLDLSMELVPIMGFGHKPGVSLPPPPTMEDLQPIIDGKKKFNFGDYVGDYIYWFLAKEEEVERTNFLGQGGMTILFLPPDPATVPQKLPIPPRLREHPDFKEIFARFDLDKIHARGRAMGDKWLKASMELYAPDLPKSPQMNGVQFVVPLLKSVHFFEASEHAAKLGKLCDFYIHESVDDKGVLFASPTDHEETLIDILSNMTEEGFRYSVR